MGFDIYGKGPKSKVGEYFRNNVWWWRPLAEYVLDNVEMAERERANWGTNDGQRVSEKTALKIADTLDGLIASGETEKYERQYKSELDALPRHTCEWCRGTGKRNDEFVQGKCNACDGVGTQKAWATNYPFCVENVKEFAHFCRHSGGFEIC